MHRSARSLTVLALAITSTIATAAESPRGEAVFQSHCAQCHAPAEITGRLATWAGKSADGLYQRIKTTMPAESLGSLPDDQYLAATAHLLTLVDIAPPAQLSSQSLAKVMIQTPSKTKLPAAPNVGWTEFNGNQSAQRYSPLDQINAGNANKLAIAWRWQAGMFGPNPELKNVCPCTAKGVDRFIRG